MFQNEGGQLSCKVHFEFHIEAIVSCVFFVQCLALNEACLSKSSSTDLKSELRVEAKFGEKFRVHLWKGGNRGCDDG
jgi:NAD kinase